MKTKNREKKQKPIDNDKRPSHYGAGFWPGDGDLIEAMHRAWMRPSEFAAWKTAKTPEEKERIEAAARIADAIEIEAELVERKAAIALELSKRQTKRKPGPGRKPYYTNKELKRVEATITAHNGSLKDAAAFLKFTVKKVKMMHDAERNRKSRKT